MNQEDPSNQQNQSNLEENNNNYNNNNYNNYTNNNPNIVRVSYPQITTPPIPILNLEVGKTYLFGENGIIKGEAQLIRKVLRGDRYFLDLRTDQAYRDREYGFIKRNEMRKIMNSYKEEGKANLSLGVNKSRNRGAGSNSDIKPHFAYEFGMMDVKEIWEDMKFYEKPESLAGGKRKKRKTRKSNRKVRKGGKSRKH